MFISNLLSQILSIQIINILIINFIQSYLTQNFQIFLNFSHILFSSCHHQLNFIRGCISAEKNYNNMKANTLFLAELYVGKCKIALQLPPKISLSFRIGKNMTQSTQTKTGKNGEIDIDTTLQLNTDQLALDTQRSSLTLSSIAASGQITVIGMALIPLSRENLPLSKKFKLAQCADKNAEIELTLSVTPFDSVLVPQGNNFGITMRSSGVSSNRSIMEMQDFDKKIISPPKLFNFIEKDHKLLPPKPRSAKELPAHTQPTEDLRESISKLQNQCECLKELLKVQIKKSDASNKLIDSLVSALQQVNASHHSDLDETLLLDGIDHDDTIDKVCQRNAQLEKEIANLHTIIEQLRAQNKNLQRTSESTRVSSREGLHSLKEIAPRQETFMQSNKKMDKVQKLQKMAVQVGELQAQIFEKYEQIQRFKKKMKLVVKIPTLQSTPIEKQNTPIANLKQVIDRIIQNNRQLMKSLLKYIKFEADSQTDGFLSKIKQKVDRTFGNLIIKKMNKDILLYQKGELVKAIEQLWQKCT